MSTSVPFSQLHDLDAFVAGHHRFPRLGDLRSPWTYPGFLLPYVIQLHNLHPHMPDRWGYYQQIRECGLTSDPIPQIAFCDSPDRTACRAVERWIRLVDETSSARSSFHSLVDWMAWALGVSSTPPSFDDDLHERLYRTVNIKPWLLHPYDYLGELLAEQRSRGWNTTGFFPTPHAVCEIMTQITMTEAEPTNGDDPRTQSIMDPCCGTGRMLLHASNYSLNLHGMDIDPLVLTITKINGALYCPWLVFPFSSMLLTINLVKDRKPSPHVLLPVASSQLPIEKEHHDSDQQLTFKF